MLFLRALSFAIVFFFLCLTARAQSISGHIIDESNKVFPGVVFSVYGMDSTVVKTAITDSIKNYFLKGIAPGKDVLKFSYSGYIEFKRAVSLTTDTLFVVTVKLIRSRKTLATVNITVEKPLITTKIDKIVVNVDSTILSEGNSVLDVLKRSSVNGICNHDLLNFGFQIL